MIYPAAERQPVVDHPHGYAVPDPYRWLEDPADPGTRAWLAAQEELWRGHAAGLPDRDAWHARVAELSGAGRSARRSGAGSAVFSCAVRPTRSIRSSTPPPPGCRRGR